MSQGKYQEVQSRASQTLKFEQEGWPFDIAMENLFLGRAYLQEVTLIRASRVGGEGVTQAAAYLQRAVDGLRQVRQQDRLPLGLLARAALYRFTGDFNKAQNDLDEAFTIAMRGGMRLHETDCHLGYARLYFAIASLRGSAATEAISKPNDEIASHTTLALTTDELMAQAREHFVKAKRMVEEIGYHRRDVEVKEIESMLNEK